MWRSELLEEPRKSEGALGGEKETWETDGPTEEAAKERPPGDGGRMVGELMERVVI